MRHKVLVIVLVLLGGRRSREAGAGAPRTAARRLQGPEWSGVPSLGVRALYAPFLRANPSSLFYFSSTWGAIGEILGADLLTSSDPTPAPLPKGVEFVGSRTTPGSPPGSP